jgi:hypothetical protein
MAWFREYVKEHGREPSALECAGHLSVLHRSNSSIAGELGDLIDANLGWSSFVSRCGSSCEQLGTAIACDKALAVEVIKNFKIMRTKFIDMKDEEKSISRTSSMLKILTGMFYPGGAGNCSAVNTGIETKRKYGGEPERSGAYPAIPSSTDKIATVARKVPEYMKGNFIDIGCGIGDKVFLYAFLSNGPGKALGIDHDWYPIVIAQNADRDWGRNGEISIPTCFKCEDAFNFDVSDYNRVYTYYPVQDEVLRKRFYTTIAKKLPVGAMWLECWGPDAMYPVTKCGFEQSEEYKYLYVKVAS